MRTYHIVGTVLQLKARTHREAWLKLAQRLRASGPRKLVARTDDGAEVSASLRKDGNYMRTVTGRVIRLE